MPENPWPAVSRNPVTLLAAGKRERWKVRGRNLWENERGSRSVGREKEKGKETRRGRVSRSEEAWLPDVARDAVSVFSSVSGQVELLKEWISLRRISQVWWLWFVMLASTEAVGLL